MRTSHASFFWGSIILAGLFMAVMLLLVGCATPSAPASACIPVRAYSAADRDKLAAAVAVLPKDNPIIPAMGEYVTLRKAARFGCILR